MKLRSLIKYNAKRALAGNWSIAVAIVMLVLIVIALFAFLEAIVVEMTGIPYYIDYQGTTNFYMDDLPNGALGFTLITTALTILYLFSATPLSLGVRRWFYTIGEGTSLPASEILFFYDKRFYFKTIKMTIIIAFKSLLWGILFMVPTIMLTLFIELYSTTRLTAGETMVLYWITLLAVIVGLITTVFFCLHLTRYFLSVYILIEEPTISPNCAIKQSVKATSGFRFEIFKLEFSLLFHRILGGLIFTGLYTMPYIKTVEGIFARFVINDYKKCQYEMSHPAVVPYVDDVTR